MLQMIKYYICEYFYGQHQFERNACNRCGLNYQVAEKRQ